LFAVDDCDGQRAFGVNPLEREPVTSMRWDSCASTGMEVAAMTPPRASATPVATFVLLNMNHTPEGKG
jgi:hypothetical protein